MPNKRFTNHLFLFLPAALPKGPLIWGLALCPNTSIHPSAQSSLPVLLPYLLPLLSYSSIPLLSSTSFISPRLSPPSSSSLPWPFFLICPPFSLTLHDLLCLFSSSCSPVSFLPSFPILPFLPTLLLFSLSLHSYLSFLPPLPPFSSFPTHFNLSCSLCIFISLQTFPSNSI